MLKGKILALDYGKSKTGFAICDISGEFVFGRGVLRTSDEKTIFVKIFQLIESENAENLLIGLPMSLNGDETPQMKIIKAFVERFLQYLAGLNRKINVKYIDESFSSFEAQEELFRLGKNMKEIRLIEDELVAITLLKKYLQKNKRK